MKLAFLALSFFSSAALACIDLTGNYVCKSQSGPSYDWIMRTEVKKQISIYNLPSIKYLDGILEIHYEFLADGTSRELPALMDGKPFATLKYVASCTNHKLKIEQSWNGQPNVHEFSFDKDGKLIIDRTQTGNNPQATQDICEKK